MITDIHYVVYKKIVRDTKKWKWLKNSTYITKRDLFTLRYD